MLDMPDATDAEKEELIEAMWLLVVSFVDAGFDVRSLETCGEAPDVKTSCPQIDNDPLCLNQSLHSAAFANAANEPATKQEAS